VSGDSRGFCYLTLTLRYHRECQIIAITAPIEL
jgi:hypothetical protein